MKRIITTFLILIIALSSCVKSSYGYFFHFYVDGGNGKIEISDKISEKSVWRCSEENNICELDCPSSSCVAKLLGGKNGSRKLTFVAIPDDGYQVKEWIFNGKIVEENNTNTFVAEVSSQDGYNGVIMVRFETIK